MPCLCRVPARAHAINAPADSAAVRTPPPTTGVRTSLYERATAVVRSPLSHACPCRHPRLAVYPVRLPPSRKPWCHRLHRVVVLSARHRAIRVPPSTPRAQPCRCPCTSEDPPCPSLHRLSCAGDVAATHARAGPSWARPWATHVAQAEAELGQARSLMHCAGRPCWYCATGPRRIRPSDI
jgi:hypothetical protein